MRALRGGEEGSACRMELAPDRPEFAADDRSFLGQLCLLHALLSCSAGKGNGRGYELRRGVYRCRREGQHDGRAVSSGKIRRGRASNLAQFCGDRTMKLEFTLTFSDYKSA